MIRFRSMASISGPRLLWRCGFTLIEVVVALGIFSVGSVAVIGLLSAATKSVSSISEVESAALVCDGLLVRLQTLSFETAARLIQDQAVISKNDAESGDDSSSRVTPAVIFAQLNGDVGIYDPAKNAWINSTGDVMADAGKFFEIDLIRNLTLSPPDGDATTAMLAFTLRVRWPAWLPPAGGAGTQVDFPNPGGVAILHSHQQVLFFTGSLRR